VVSEPDSFNQEISIMAKKKKKKRRKKRKKKEKKEMSKKKKRRRRSSKHFKLRRQSKTKRYYILKIFKVEGMAVKVEEIVTVVEVVVKKDIMRRMSNQANKIGRGRDGQSNYSNIESGFEKIVGATTSKEVWDILEKMFKGADRVKQMRLQTLRGELESMKMKESESVSDYITRVQAVVNQLIRNGEALTDARVVEKILRSLIDNFENVMCAIEEPKDLTNLTVDELAGSLEAHEQCKRKKGRFIDDESYVSSSECYKSVVKSLLVVFGEPVSKADVSKTHDSLCNEC
jgi:gag-polypeptide of LTR copia-type